MNLPLTTNELNHLVDKVDPIFTRFNNKTSLRNIGAFREQAFGNAIAFQDSKKPASTYFNRVVGLRIQEIGELDAIIALYDSENLDCVISLPPHRQHSEVLSTLQEKGFKYIGSDYNFCLRANDVAQLDSPVDVNVRPVTEDLLPTLFDLFRSSGSILEPEAIRQNSSLFYGGSFQFFIAFIDGVPAASASVNCIEGVAWLNNAVTQEAYRGRGCHRALLQTRINAAQDNGCSLIVSDTDFGSTSHRNMARVGFQLAFTSAEFLRTSTAK